MLPRKGSLMGTALKWELFYVLIKNFICMFAAILKLDIRLLFFGKQSNFNV